MDENQFLPNGKRGPGAGGPQFGDLNDDAYGSKNRGCAYYFKKFDDQILRPIFVYKYAEKKFKPEISFDTLLRASEKDLVNFNFNTMGGSQLGSRKSYNSVSQSGFRGQKKQVTKSQNDPDEHKSSPNTSNKGSKNAPQRVVKYSQS